MNDGVYVSSDEIKKVVFNISIHRQKQPLKPQEVIITHSINGRDIRFKFIDNPSRLSREDWHRVVCVMAGSQAWQFRGWRYSNPTDVFSRMLGVFIWFSELSIPPLVNGWNVKVVTVRMCVVE